MDVRKCPPKLCRWVVKLHEFSILFINRLQISLEYNFLRIWEWVKTCHEKAFVVKARRSIRMFLMDIVRITMPASWGAVAKRQDSCCDISIPLTIPGVSIFDKRFLLLPLKIVFP